jgi:hypothetical protein
MKHQTKRRVSRPTRSHSLKRIHFNGGGIFSTAHTIMLKKYRSALEKRLKQHKIPYDDLRKKYMNLGLY